MTLAAALLAALLANVLGLADALVLRHGIAPLVFPERATKKTPTGDSGMESQ